MWMFFFFQLKKIWDVQVTKSEDHIYFFGKLSEQREKNKKKKHITQKSSQCPIHWGPNPDPLFRLGCRHPSISLQGLWSTRDLNLGVEKIITRPPHDRWPISSKWWDLGREIWVSRRFEGKSRWRWNDPSVIHVFLVRPNPWLGFRVYKLGAAFDPKISSRAICGLNKFWAWNKWEKWSSEMAKPERNPPTRWVETTN